MPVFPAKAVLAGICLALLPHAAAADPVYDLFDALFGPPREDRAISQRHGRKHRGGHVAQFSGNMVASFYGGGERLNSHTANGERFRPGAFTAAHRSLPFGTLLNVCYRGCATVRINDRGRLHIPAALSIFHAAQRTQSACLASRASAYRGCDHA